MNRITAMTLAAAVALAAFSPFPATRAEAHDMMVGNLMLIHPTARPNMPDRPTAAYVTISNDGTEADRLVGASSSEFDSAELHNVTMQDGIMKMFPVEGIDLPAGDTTELAPGGYHIMLFGAKKLFKPGDEFPLTLTFEKAGEATIQAMVEKIDAMNMGNMGTMDHGTMGHGQMNQTKP